MVTQNQQPLTDTGGPSIGFKAAIAFYLGVLVAGIITVVGVLAGAENATVLSTFPTVVTAVTVVGVVLADRTTGLPARLGRTRRRRLVWYLPPLALGTALFAHGVGVVTLEWPLSPVVGVLAVLTTPLAIGGARMARTRVVTARTSDEPAATWTWHRSGLLSSRNITTAMLVLSVLPATALLIGGDSLLGLFWIGYSAFFLYSTWTDRTTAVDPTSRWNPPTLQVHETGLRLEKAISTKLVPWAAIESVRLTDDELVIERRRWLDIRCDRAAIDEPERVLAEIERARRTDESRVPTTSPN